MIGVQKFFVKFFFYNCLAKGPSVIRGHVWAFIYRHANTLRFFV